LCFGKAKNQNPGSFDQPYDEGVGIGIELDCNADIGIDAHGDFAGPPLDLGGRWIASLRAQHEASR